MSTLVNTQPEQKPNNATATDQKVLAYLNAEFLDYYDALISEEENFQVWYQLSSLRIGLISWYEFKENASVLEIGAGFGALTGMLCEKCAKVSATERSFVRAEAIAKRWEGKENLTVYAGEWSEISFPEKFDYIIITGVMERIGGGSNLKQVYVDYLKKAANLLAPGGKILVSVENRYGLRYFCGAVEPHTNRAFDGIRKYMQGTKGYSFSRQELEEIVTDAGFTNHKFYYPLPDYKFPQLIYTDEYLPEKNLKERLIPYYTRKDTLVARELELYDDVVTNGAFAFMANSFLVEGCANASDLCDVVYAAVSTDRGKERAFTTSIMEGKKGVRKTPIFPEGQTSADALYAHISDLEAHGIPVVSHKRLANGGLELPYISWPTLSNAIKEIMPKDSMLFEELVDKVYQYILASSEETTENKFIDRLVTAGVPREDVEALDFGPILKKAYMELIPLNCFYDADTNTFLYFDQEFVRENYPAKYVLFRAIHYIYCFTPNAQQYYPRQKLIEKYGMQDTWQYFQKEENMFLDEVRNHKKYAQFYKWAHIDEKRMLDNSDRLVSEEEVIANYKISDKMKKVWRVELQIFDEIVRICKENNLKYYLVHGSLLGAVRHKGFIPWDDDLDIAMPRADYDHFLEIAANELKEPLSLHTPATETDLFWGGFARIRNGNTTGIEVKDLGHDGNLGIWVDILPLDVCPMDDEILEKKSRKIRHVQRMLYAKTYTKDDAWFGVKRFGMKKPLWLWYCLFSKSYSRAKLCEMLDAAMRLYTSEESEDVAFFTGYYKHRRLLAKDFGEGTQLLFEGRKVSVPSGYENYLFTILGKDYMKFPPEEQRKPHHRGIMDPDNKYELYNDLLCNMLADAKGKSIILFGSGMMFEDYMKQYGDKYRPAFLVDNDSNKWGRQRMGIEIRKPEDILSVPENKRHVIICSFYYREIMPQLEQMGIKDYKVYVQHVNWILETEEKQKTSK